MTDSIGKNLAALPGVTLIVRRGAYLESFTQSILSGDVSLQGMDALLLHVGTNNIDRDRDPQSVLIETGNLIRVAKVANPTMHVVVSGILPRICDLSATEGLVKEYNKLLGRVCRDNQVMMIRSFTAFTCGKEPNGIKAWLFAADGLHLSPRGSAVLTQLFRVQFSDRNIQQRHFVMKNELAKKNLRDENFGFNMV